MPSKPSKPRFHAGLQGSRASQRLAASSPQTGASQAFLMEIQNPPWAPFYVKHMHKDRTFTVTHAREDAWTFADQGAETLALVTAEVATWPLKPGPVLYVLKGI